MAEQKIDYYTFEPDWWGGVGVSAEEVKGGIESIIQDAYGGSISDITKKALVDAAYQHYLAQNAMKASAAAAQNTLQYADLPDSALYKNAMATSKTYDTVARSELSQEGQIMENAKANAVLASSLTKFSSILAPSVNIARLSGAVYKRDAYEVAKAAISILAGMPVGALVSSVMAE